MFCRLSAHKRATECFLLCVWVTCLRCSATVDGEPTWIDQEEIYEASHHAKKHHTSHNSGDFSDENPRLNTKKPNNSKDTDGLQYGNPNSDRHSPFVQFYTDLGVIVIIMIAFYLFWRIFALSYPLIKFCGSRTENHQTEIPMAGRNRLEGCSHPDGTEVVIGFDNPLYVDCFQEQSEDNIESKDKPPDYETVVFNERRESAPSSDARKDPETPPPKYFKNDPLFE